MWWMAAFPNRALRVAGALSGSGAGRSRKSQKPHGSALLTTGSSKPEGWAPELVLGFIVWATRPETYLEKLAAPAADPVSEGIYRQSEPF